MYYDIPKIVGASGDIVWQRMSENPRSNYVRFINYGTAVITSYITVFVALFVLVHFFDYISIFIANFLRDTTYMLR